jgi:hypothetical protein
MSRAKRKAGRSSAVVQWRAGLIKNKWVQLGPFWAPDDATAATAEALKKFQITDPNDRRRLSVQRG